jgi:hypothetical protein
VDPLGLAECPGGDGCKNPSIGEQDPAKGVGVDDGEATLPSSKKENEYLYRGDLRRPDEVFEAGFVSKGKSKDLFLHLWDNKNPPSNFVSASTDIEIAIDFGTEYRTKKGFVYTLKKIWGHDINKEFHPNDIPFSYEDEIAIPDRVKSEDIMGATPLKKDGSYIGYSIPNPRRK